MLSVPVVSQGVRMERAAAWAQHMWVTLEAAGLRRAGWGLHHMSHVQLLVHAC